MTLKRLSDLYLRYQHSRVLAGALTPKHYNDQIRSLGRLMSFLGQGCKIESISTLDLQNYKRKLQSAYASVDRQNLHISVSIYGRGTADVSGARKWCPFHIIQPGYHAHRCRWHKWGDQVVGCVYRQRVEDLVWAQVPGPFRRVHSRRQADRIRRL